tara:strand:+ start:1293 stop:1574 length:282 start_codon:yes stop_codon:yes gene_type:complete
VFCFVELNPIEACFHQYKSVLKRNREHFALDVLGVHYFALSTSVNRNNMINYYNATAMQGCIHNVPALSKKRKKRSFDFVLVGLYILSCADEK